MADSKIQLRKFETQEEIDQFVIHLKARVEKTKRVVEEIRKSSRVTNKLLQMSFCNCGGRCGRGARG